jgi:hypothetical protein
VARGRDNLKRFIKPGLLTVNGIDVSSTSEKSDLRFSATHNYLEGIVPHIAKGSREELKQ